MADPATLSLFTNTFITHVLIPFIFVFVITFAVLQRSKILGEDKKAADILVALSIGLVFIGVPAFVGFTLKFIPMIALILIGILGFLLVFGFAGIEIRQNTGIKIAAGIIFALGIATVVFWASGILPAVGSFFVNNGAYVTLFIVVAGALTLVITTSGNKNKSNS